jgi:hypothetical protein
VSGGGSGGGGQIIFKCGGRKRVFQLRHFLCVTRSGGWSDHGPSTHEETFPVTHYALAFPPAQEGRGSPPSAALASLERAPQGPPTSPVPAEEALRWGDGAAVRT